MAILKLLSEEVFDFSRGELTQVRGAGGKVLQGQKHMGETVKARMSTGFREGWAGESRMEIL